MFATFLLEPIKWNIGVRTGGATGAMTPHFSAKIIF